MSIGYFEPKGGDLIPSYQIDFRLYENGVSRELFIDYGDFSIHGTLTALEYLKAPLLSAPPERPNAAQSCEQASKPRFPVRHEPTLGAAIAELSVFPGGFATLSKEIGYRFTVKSPRRGGWERTTMFWRVRPAPSTMAHYHEFAHHGPTESPGPRPMTKTVLIVEDNELNMKLFHDLLDAHGYKTFRRGTAWRRWRSPASIARISS